MHHVLFLECSPHGENSWGAQQVRAVLADPGVRRRGLRVACRHLAQPALAPLSAAYAQAVLATAPRDAPDLALSERLIAELEASDALLISTPVHNSAIPAALKLWIDHVLRRERSFTVTAHGKVGLLRDRPTLVLVRSGSVFTGDGARQPDFLTPYLHHALGTAGIHDVRFAYLPGRPPAADALARARQALHSFFASPLCAGKLP